MSFRTKVQAAHLEQVETLLGGIKQQLKTISRLIDSVNAKQGVGKGKIDETMDKKIDTLIEALRKKLNRGSAT